jgi:8-oxo-dGTP diphosphatase
MLVIDERLSSPSAAGVRLVTGTACLQFGTAEPGLVYRLRATAFGLVTHEGKLACVRVDRGEGSYFDLPGGAVDGAETEEQALLREFLEETGMSVRAVARIAEASQFFRKSDGAPVNNSGGFWTAECLALDPSAKIEADHDLVWLHPHEALTMLRHDAHAWAVAVWMRGHVQLSHTERP